jgi:ATP/maltotriose-dependent transcriptional regulator MalT
MLRPQRQTDDTQAGHEALARGAWADARAHFAAALAHAETPEALEGFGMAAWWLTDSDAYFPARERAYRLYEERGDRRGAGRTAIWLGLDAFLYRGEHAICTGWFRRAHRLLDDLDPGPEQPMLAIWEGYVALMVRHDTACARRRGVEAQAAARAIGSLDIEMLAQALLGLALVSVGEVAEGLSLLDEAAAVATTGEIADLDAVVTTCCFMIAACEQVRDYDRAAQWCARAIEIAAQWSYRFILSYCRTHHAGLLFRRGAWVGAEAELLVATGDLATTHPAMAAEGLVLLAELRRCQGRPAEASALLDRLETGPLRMLGAGYTPIARAALALEEGNAQHAADLAERALRAASPEYPLGRVPGLEMLVRARVALGDRALATEALAALQALTDPISADALRASTLLAAGLVARAEGDHDAARRAFEDAIDLFARSGAQFDVACTRLELAATLALLGRVESAGQEARTARDALAHLGAAPAVARADTLLRSLRPPGQEGGDGGARAALTPRELEVLRLVARGQSDREIAVTLKLSAHTVHRHIANILTRLALPSRAAAVAHAARHGLL